MMEYITASCLISPHTVYKDGTLVLQHPPSDPIGFLTTIYHHFGFQYPKFYKMDNLSKLGWLATELLLQDGFDPQAYKPEDVAVVLSNASSSLDTDYKYWATVQEIPSPAVFVYTLPNIMIGEISIRHRFKGENAFFITDTFDIPFTHQYVQGLLTEDTRACICGWVELMNDQYTAALFLVEKDKPGDPFTIDNMNQIVSSKSHP